MKKVLLFIVMLISANIMFAQTATLRVGDVDLTGVAVGGDVVIPLYVDEIDDGTIFTMQYFVGFDHAVLTWKGSFANPLTGIQNFHPDFPYGTPNGAWLFNDNGTELVTLWDDASMFHTMPSPDQVFYEMIFTYNGGLNPGDESPLIWGTSGKDVGGKYVKGTTEMYDQNFSQYLLTLVDGSVFIPGEEGKVWTGAGGDLDWFNGANWAPPGAPTAGDDVTVNAGTKAVITISGGVASTAALTVAAGAGITIASDGGLTTNGLYTNDGDLTIESDGNGNTGTYINNAGIGGIGNFMLDRFVLCSGTVGGSSNDLGWHYLSAPFDGFTTDAIPEFFVNGWNQGLGEWMQYEGPIGLPCMPIAPAIPLNTMDAWSINLDVDYGPVCGLPFDQTANFMSNAAGVHTGPYNAALGFGGGAFQEWNMVGNPYPSGLDVDAMTFGANTIQSTYFFDGCVGNYVYWTKGAPGMGTTNSSIMAPTMGFFVETTGPDNLAVNDAMRAHNADWFWKSDVSNLLKIQATGNEKSDVLLVRFSDDATNGMDMQGDARKLFASTEGLAQIYTTFGDLQFAINSLPSTESVPMGFKANGSGTYTIEAIETSEFDNVVLEDLSNGVQTDLLAGSYTFDYTSGEHGFVIHFTPLGTRELAANSINIWAANQTIYVQAPATKGDIAVYNMMGQVVVKTAIVPGLNEIPMNTSNTYYIVKVLGSDVTETGKVFIK